MKQSEKVLAALKASPGKWFYPMDFMRPDSGQYFVGYEASARLSELAKKYPDNIESERDGKYIKRRWKPSIPEEQPKAVSWLYD